MHECGEDNRKILMKIIGIRYSLTNHVSQVLGKMLLVVNIYYLSGRQISLNPAVAWICAPLSHNLYYCAEKQNDVFCKYVG